MDRTVGDVREELKKDTAQGRIPTGMNKWDILDYKIMESVTPIQSFHCSFFEQYLNEYHIG